MPDKFIVPQFIDTEDRILGPITVRQFLIMLGGTFLVMIEYAFFKFSLLFLLLTVLPTWGIAAVFAFARINGQPFHIFFINFLQTGLRPHLRVWHKELSDTELRALIKIEKTEPIQPSILKTPPTSTHLRDLTLTVNTGGVYNPDKE